MWNNIPQELKDYPQWCCAGQYDRAPIDPKTGNLASVDNPASWGTFEQAINAGYPHIGFMLWSSDP
jgi:primase-polymerase (primpol)-like protein